MDTDKPINGHLCPPLSMDTDIIITGIANTDAVTDIIKNEIADTGMTNKIADTWYFDQSEYILVTLTVAKEEWL